jgi:hypothetical protein
MSLCEAFFFKKEQCKNLIYEKAEKKDIPLCKVHYDMYNLKLSDYMLVHSTKFKYTENILKVGKINCLKNIKNFNLEYTTFQDLPSNINKERYKELVFTRLIFSVSGLPDIGNIKILNKYNFNPTNNYPEPDVYLIFDTSILSNKEYFCTQPNYGVYEKRLCKKPKATLKDSLNEWRRFDYEFNIKNYKWFENGLYSNPYDHPLNEIAVEGDISLEHLKYIFVNVENIGKRYHKKLYELVKSYPELPWVFSIEEIK